MKNDVSFNPETKRFVKKQKKGNMVKTHQVKLSPENDEEIVNNENTDDENGVDEKVEITEERSEAEQINELIDKGYDARQLVKEFGFHRDTVRQQVKKRVSPEDRSGVDEERLPTVLRRAEVIAPEAIMREYLIEDGDEGRGMIKGMMLLRAAQRMVMDDVQIMQGMADADAKKLTPILKLMAETRKEQDAAAERAKASNEEIATSAAQDALAGAIQYLSQQAPAKADIATVSNPMMGIMARAMEPALTGLISNLLVSLGKKSGKRGGQGPSGQDQTQVTSSLPTGWVDESKKAETMSEE